MNIFGKVIDLHEKRIFDAELKIADGKIVTIERSLRKSQQYILSGLIDSHVHVESSMMVPSNFAHAAVQHGTVAAVADPHEIANVLGIEGVDFMISDAEKVPMKFYFGAPSCVPATNFETSGAVIGSNEIEGLLKRKDIWFLSEVMNFPGVINEERSVIKIIEAAHKSGKRIDGHAPGLTGKDLEKYCEKGISTDHESVNIEEAREKIERGMKIMIREGSAARNLEELHMLFEEFPEKLMLCCDDIHPEMLQKGHIDKIVRDLLGRGYDLFDVLRAASVNTVEHYSLDVGTLRPDQPADFIVIDNPKDFNILETWIDGKKIYDRGKVSFETGKPIPVNRFNSSMISPEELVVKNSGRAVRVIKANDGELVTYKEEVAWTNMPELTASVSRDILKIVVKDRYNDGPPSVAFISGFSLNHGAFASSVAHDSHNIVAVGTNDEDISNAINIIVQTRGGLSCCNKGEQLVVPLSIAGIMTDVPCGTIAAEYKKLSDKVRDMGSQLKAPFMTLSFMSLLVIPHLKLGDRGLFDVDCFEFVDLFV